MLYSLGDIVKTKKSHPCGGNIWEVVRVGADFKLKCANCGHVVIVSSEDMKKIIVSKVEK